MQNIESLESFQESISTIPFLLTYLSTPDCGVCKALLPKIETMVQKIPNLEARYVDLSKNPEVGGQYSVFTIPGILVFVNGKENIREARYVSLDDLQSRLERIQEMAFS